VSVLRRTASRAYRAVGRAIFNRRGRRRLVGVGIVALLERRPDGAIRPVWADL
jgi:hypothetical protein